MTSLPILRAEAERTANELRSANMADRKPWAEMPTLKAAAAQAARTLAIAEDAVKIERAGILEAIGGMRWQAEEAEQHVRAGALRDAEDLVKGLGS